MKEFVDEKGNLIFQINSRRIIIDISKLRVLTGANILSVFGSIKSLSGRLFDDGEALRKKNRKEGWIRLNLNKIISREENSVVQKKVIEVLSHEARHISQPQSKSGLLRFCKKLYVILFLPLVIICALEVIAGIVFWLTGFNIPGYLRLFLILFPTFLIFVTVSYVLSPEERDARKFSKKAIKDKRWLEIVQVKEVKEK